MPSQPECPHRHPQTRTNYAVNTGPTPSPPIPPLENIVVSGNVPLELVDLAGGSSANVDTFEEEFLRSLPTHVDGNDSGILDDDGLTDTTNKTPPSLRDYSTMVSMKHHQM